MTEDDRKLPPPPPRAPECPCGHSMYVHFITANKERGRCSSWHGGRCPCRGYTRD